MAASRGDSYALPPPSRGFLPRWDVFEAGLAYDGPGLTGLCMDSRRYAAASLLSWTVSVERLKHRNAYVKAWAPAFFPRRARASGVEWYIGLHLGRGLSPPHMEWLGKLLYPLAWSYEKAVLSQRWPPNAPYTWVPWKFSGLPDYAQSPTATIPNIFMGFCSNRPSECFCKIWSRSFTWDNRGTQKIWAVPGYAHAPFSPIN